MSDISCLAIVVAETVTNRCWGAIDQSWESTSIRSKSVHQRSRRQPELVIGWSSITGHWLTSLNRSRTSCFMVSAHPSIQLPGGRALMPVQVDPRSKNTRSYHRQASTKQIDSTDKQITRQSKHLPSRNVTKIMW